MSSNDRVEYYLEPDAKHPFVSVESSIVPVKGSYVNIKGKTYKVTLVTFALDHSDRPTSERVHRANVDIKPVK